MRLSRQNVRLAARSLARQRGFSIVAILSLALAIALNTTMFSVLDAMLNPRLDFREPEHVVVLRPWISGRWAVDDPTRAALIRAATKTFEDASYHTGNFLEQGAVEYGQRYAQVSSGTVAPNFFSMLGSKPIAGRLFVPGDYAADAGVVVISDRLAATLSPDKPFPLGDVIDVDRRPVHVIGIIRSTAVPPDFDREDLWRLPPPTTSAAGLPINLLRVRSSATLVQAQSEMDLVAARFAQIAGLSSRDVWFQLLPASQSRFQILSFHYALIASVIAVLLIACANLANLQLARGIGRSRELAVRTALGATRADIITQLVLESALLVGAGLFTGLLLTFWGVDLLAAHIPKSVAGYFVAPHTSWRVLLFAAAASAFCTLVVGLAPAIRVSRVDPNDLMKAGAGTGAHRKSRRQYGLMVAIEVGLALAVLSGAAVVVRTAMVVRDGVPAIDLRPLSSASIFLVAPHDTVVSTPALHNWLLSRAHAIPDAHSAAVRIDRSVVDGAVTYDERGGTPREFKSPMLGYTEVSSTYLRTFGRTVVKGRDFLDGTPSNSEVIVDEHTANVLWPNADPIGQQIKLGAYASGAPWARVVGVARDFRDPRWRERLVYSPAPMQGQLGEILYLPSSRDSVHFGEHGTRVHLIVRAASDPERMPISLMLAIPQAGIVRFVQASTLEDAWGLVWDRQRHDFIAGVFGVFALLAVSLAALGIYGIVAHSVAERRRELGVRIALGATTRNIVSAVIREGNPIVLAGIAIGLYFTKSTVAWLHIFSLEGDEYDATLFAAMAFTLFFIAVVAALIPALRATRIDPVESLRSE
jgi:putative ABC transport system permease protein